MLHSYSAYRGLINPLTYAVKQRARRCARSPLHSFFFSHCFILTVFSDFCNDCVGRIIVSLGKAYVGSLKLFFSWLKQRGNDFCVHNVANTVWALLHRLPRTKCWLSTHEKPVDMLLTYAAVSKANIMKFQMCKSILLSLESIKITDNLDFTGLWLPT